MLFTLIIFFNNKNLIKFVSDQQYDQRSCDILTKLSMKGKLVYPIVFSPNDAPNL